MVEKNEKEGEWVLPSKKSTLGSLNNNDMNNDLNIFCVKCGTKSIKTEKFCGNCGTKLISIENENINYETYRPDNSNYQVQYPQPITVNRPSESSIEWKPVIIGGLIAVGVSALLGILIGILLYDASIYTILGAIALGNITSLIIGGLFAGIFAKTKGGTHGAYAGLTCVFISLPINIIMGMPVSFFSMIFAALWAMLFAGIGGLIGYAVTKSSKLQIQPISQTLVG